MAKLKKRQQRLADGYSFAGFRAAASVRGVFGDPQVRVVRLDRRSKKRFAAVAGGFKRGGTTDGCGVFATCRVQDFGLFWNWKCDASRVAVVAP
jgi:hypothetical protein